MSKEFLRDGASCRYEIVFPNGANTDDQLTVKLNRVKDMRVFVVGAKDYSDQDFRETMLYNEGDSFMVEWP
jgi:hypothetical protein